MGVAETGLEHAGTTRRCPNLTSAVESQFFTFWADKSYRFNKSLLKAVNSDEYL